MHPIQEALILLLDELAKHADPRIASKARRLSQEIASIDQFGGNEETIG